MLSLCTRRMFIAVFVAMVTFALLLLPVGCLTSDAGDVGLEKAQDAAHEYLRARPTYEERFGEGWRTHSVYRGAGVIVLLATAHEKDSSGKRYSVELVVDVTRGEVIKATEVAR